MLDKNKWILFDPFFPLSLNKKSIKIKWCVNHLIVLCWKIVFVYYLQRFLYLFHRRHEKNFFDGILRQVKMIEWNLNNVKIVHIVRFNPVILKTKLTKHSKKSFRIVSTRLICRTWMKDSHFLCKFKFHSIISLWN